ncbi:GNAT family N-acetyltransferase [Actinacidiphila sp. bgisy144]|uniref:GNAT family N-acetyltransferase n=1 Tax=Actinacidiphila sp. bgisy144 TaxID=3413791 RepID=UPI003EB9320E
MNDRPRPAAEQTPAEQAPAEATAATPASAAVPATTVVRWPGPGLADGQGPAGLLAAYHLQTQAEKGEAVTDVADLPERYRAEVLDPWTAFAADTVLLAVAGDAVPGCLVLTGAVGGAAEIKRLWTAPEYRGRGIAAALVRAALTEAAARGVHTLRLSVWDWRTGAIALYERLGFAPVPARDDRPRLLHLARPV